MGKIRNFSLLALALFAGVAVARADSPSVTAVLTSSETEVDQPVQLQIKVTGDANAAPPSDIAIDGLDIRYSGQSQLVEGRNFRFTYSFVYNYTILPLKAGTFTIPAQLIRSSSGNLRTPPLTLTVSPNDDGSATSQRGSRRSGSGIDQRKIAFVDLIIPKTSVFVGESVPAEIRIGLLSRIPGKIVDLPTLSGQGFTSQKMPNPDQEIQSINGRPYIVVTLKTAITPVHTGKLEIAAKDAKAIVQVPRAPSARQRSPFDAFGMNDPFNDPFFADPFGGIGEQKEISFSSEKTVLEVKPLPSGAPADFSGAVGNFTLATSVKPKTVQVGDPLTLTATISGRGNFDRVSAPTLESDAGWHLYPPGSSFKGDDDVGLSGSKTFDMVLTPNEPKKAVPPLLFSYFDPLKEKYITLKSQRLPVIVEGHAPATTPTPAIASAGNAAATPGAPQPAGSPQGQDILYQLSDHGGWQQTFAPLYQQPLFWASQSLPLLGLIGFFGWEMRRRRLENKVGLRLASWENEAGELEKKLRRANDPPDQYYAEALRVVQLKTALAMKDRALEPNAVDAEVATAAFGLAPEQRAQMEELFRRSDEVRYSGAANGREKVTEQTRQEVLQLIDRLS